MLLQTYNTEQGSQDTDRVTLSPSRPDMNVILNWRQAGGVPSQDNGPGVWTAVCPLCATLSYDVRLSQHCLHSALATHMVVLDIKMTLSALS